MKKVNCICTLFFTLILAIICVGVVYAAGNPFLDIINKNKTQPVKENPLLQQPVNAITTPVLKPLLPVNVTCTVTSGQDFMYILTHRDREKIKALYDQSNKELTLVQFMYEYDKKNVKIVMIKQQLQFGGSSFTGECGCVQNFQRNHYVVPVSFPIHTKMNLTINKKTTKCKCGFNKV